jgi:hypothetical protein
MNFEASAKQEQIFYSGIHVQNNVHGMQQSMCRTKHPRQQILEGSERTIIIPPILQTVIVEDTNVYIYIRT